MVAFEPIEFLLPVEIQTEAYPPVFYEYEFSYVSQAWGIFQPPRYSVLVYASCTDLSVWYPVNSGESSVTATSIYHVWAIRPHIPTGFGTNSIHRKMIVLGLLPTSF